MSDGNAVSCLGTIETGRGVATAALVLYYAGRHVNELHGASVWWLPARLRNVSIAIASCLTNGRRQSAHYDVVIAGSGLLGGPADFSRLAMACHPQ
jgi:hypothetical protein